jgi:hypothetical protein
VPIGKSLLQLDYLQDISAALMCNKKCAIERVTKELPSRIRHEGGCCLTASFSGIDSTPRRDLIRRAAPPHTVAGLHFSTFAILLLILALWLFRFLLFGRLAAPIFECQQ